MPLNPVTQRILQQVEEVSGLPVVVQADPTVRLATVVMARGSAPGHLVKYNPTVQSTVDYTVCFHCAFILRIFSLPPSDRFDLQGSTRGRTEAETLFTQHFAKKGSPLSPMLRAQLQNQMCDGLILQLRSMPIAMRVDAWLRRECPELIDEQKVANSRQLNENATCLRPDVHQMTPAKILNANIAMNAAFAAYWSRTWDDPLLVVPYKTSANLADGQALLKLWDEIPDDPANDKRTIETWGDRLKLKGWYDIIPYA